MTVADLINALARFDLDAVVVLARDIEGNGFSLLDEIDRGVYVPVTQWSGEVKLAPDQLTPAMRDAGCSETDVYDGPDGRKAVVLWPTN